jgi:hypothetical protein
LLAHSGHLAVAHPDQAFPSSDYYSQSASPMQNRSINPYRESPLSRSSYRDSPVSRSSPYATSSSKSGNFRATTGSYGMDSTPPQPISSKGRSGMNDPVLLNRQVRR